MKKTLLSLLLAGTIGLGTVGIPSTAEYSDLSRRRANQTTHICFWEKLFTEPVETLYIIMEDGSPFRHSNQYENLIYCDIAEFKKRLKTPQKKYKIEDIAIVIHNHFVNNKFSEDDIRRYEELKKEDFDGLFLMYCRRTNESYNIKDFLKPYTNKKSPKKRNK